MSPQEPQCPSLFFWGGTLFRCQADLHTIEQTLHCWLDGPMLVEWDDAAAVQITSEEVS